MKRFFLLMMIFVFFLGGKAQLSVKGNHVKFQDVEGVDLVIQFTKIDKSAEIHYKSANPSTIVRWFTFSNGKKSEVFNFSKISSTETYIDPKNNTGYIVNADGMETVVWVVDKSMTANNSDAWYEDINGNRRHAVITSLSTGNQKQATFSKKTDSNNQEEVPEIGCKITTSTTAREALNENQRPEEKTLEGSAPLEIRFASNPEGNVQNFLWNIYKDGALIVTRTEENHQYTFTETGKYKVTLKVSNNETFASDSVDVSIVESKIAAPRVFTPNGDGINDEFRVAYTSIAEFQGTVLNRWGRVVFSWTNPQLGWDGNIGGKPAPEGAYFYIIRAKGSDGIPYLLKGHTNLLR